MTTETALLTVMKLREDFIKAGVDNYRRLLEVRQDGLEKTKVAVCVSGGMVLVNDRNDPDKIRFGAARDKNIASANPSIIRHWNSANPNHMVRGASLEDVLSEDALRIWSMIHMIESRRLTLEAE